MAPKPKKPSTSYSPWSMGAKEAGEMYGRARDKQTKYLTEKEKAKKNPMGLKQANLDKPKRSAKAGSSTVSKVVKRAKTVAREAGDVKKAVKNVAKSGKSALNLDRTGNQYLGRQAVRETGKDLKKQLKEFGSAVKSGKPGTRAGNIRYNADTGTPAGLLAKQRPKTGRGKLPYETKTKK